MRGTGRGTSRCHGPQDGPGPTDFSQTAPLTHTGLCNGVRPQYLTPATPLQLQPNPLPFQNTCR